MCPADPPGPPLAAAVVTSSEAAPQQNLHAHALGSRSWIEALRPRLIAHWPLKASFTPLVMGGFFVVYFHLLHHLSFAVTVMPQIVLDRIVTFHPAAMVPYASLWTYVLAAVALLQGKREIFAYCLGVAFLAGVGLGAFLLWPTATPPAQVNWGQYPAFQFLKQVDATGNAFPSLHVAFALFTAVWLERIFRAMRAPGALRAASAAWCLLIVYSTLATKQHVMVDVLAGIALGGAGCLIDHRDPAARLHAAAAWPNRLALAALVSLSGKAAAATLHLAGIAPVVPAILFVAPDLWIMFALLVPNAVGLVPTATRFAPSGREVWLTIDDGPEPATTAAMLDLLQRHDAKATFFVIGTKADAHPELLREIVRHGHSIGNHTSRHPVATFWMAGPRRTAQEVDACDAALRRAGVQPAPWFRAPAGIKSLFLRGVLARRGRMLLGWSARGLETVGRSIDAPLARLKRKVRPGAILLVHESATQGPQRLALLAALLQHLSDAGYRCVLPERQALR